MWTARSRWSFMSRDTVERETPITWHTSGTESAGRPARPVGVWELAISATFTVERAGKVGERPPVPHKSLTVVYADSRVPWLAVL
jgi:hypothetical protein